MPYQYNDDGSVVEVRTHSGDGSFTAGLKAGGTGLVADMGALGAALGLDTRDFSNRWREKSEGHAADAPNTTWDSVNGAGDLGSYLAYNVGQSLPFMATMAVPGVGAGGAASRLGLSAAGKAAAKLAAESGAEGLASRAALAEAAKQVAIRRAGTAGAVAGGTVQGAGDIAGNQYEENQQYDLGSIAALAPLYGALGFLGPEAMLAKAATGGGFLPSALRGTVEKTGLTGMAQRGALGLAAAAPIEALSETGQEVTNQIGRMAVNPEATLTSGNALDHYKESAIAGGLLGGVFGGVGGVFTKPYKADKEAIAKRTDQLMQDQEAITLGMKTNAEDLAEHAQWLKDTQKVKEEGAKTQRMDKATEPSPPSGFQDMSFLADQYLAGRKAQEAIVNAQLERLTTPDAPAAPAPAPVVPTVQDAATRFVEGALAAAPKMNKKQQAGLVDLIQAFPTLTPSDQWQLLTDLGADLKKAPFADALVAGLAKAPEIAAPLNALLAPSPVAQPRVEAAPAPVVDTSAEEALAAKIGGAPVAPVKWGSDVTEVAPVPASIPNENAVMEALIPEKGAKKAAKVAAPVTPPAPSANTPPTAPHPKYAKYMHALDAIGTELASIHGKLKKRGSAFDKAALRARRTELETQRTQLEDALEGKEVVQPAAVAAPREEVIRAVPTEKTGQSPDVPTQENGQEEKALLEQGNYVPSLETPPVASTEPVVPNKERAAEAARIKALSPEQSKAELMAKMNARVAVKNARTAWNKMGSIAALKYDDMVPSIKAEWDAAVESGKATMALADELLARQMRVMKNAGITWNNMIKQVGFDTLTPELQDEWIVAVDTGMDTDKLAKDIATRNGGTENAVQVESPDGQVQRGQGPEVGLQEVGQGNAQPEVAAPEAKAKAQEKVIPADTRSELELGNALEEAEGRLNSIQGDPLEAEQASALRKEIAHIKGAIKHRHATPKENLQEISDLKAGEDVEAQVDSAEATTAQDGLPTVRGFEEEGRYDSIGPQSVADKDMKLVLWSNPTGTSVLKHIEQNGYFAERAVAEWLRALGAGRVPVTYTGELKESKNPGSYSRGTYNTGTGRITIHKHGENVNTLLHELLHAVTHTRIKAMELLSEELANMNYPSAREKRLARLSAEEQQSWYAYTQLEALKAEAQSKIAGNKFDYAYTNVHEFVSEALSNAAFQRALMDTPSTTEFAAPSLWNLLKEMFNTLLGRTVPVDSILGRIFEVTPYVATEYKGQTFGNGTIYQSMGTAADALSGGSVVSPNLGMVADVLMGPTAMMGKPDRAQQLTKVTNFPRSPSRQETTTEWRRKVKDFISQGIEEVSTVRNIARHSMGWSKLVSLVGDYNQLKSKLRGKFNRLMAPYFNARLTTEEHAQVADMVGATTLIKMKKITQEFLSDWVDKGRPIIRLDEEGFAVPADELAALGKFTQEEFRAGVTPENYGEVKFDFTDDASSKRVWAAYEGAMDAMFSGAAENLRAQTDSRAALMGHKALETVRHMTRNLATQQELLKLFELMVKPHEDVYRRNESHSSGSKKAILLSKASQEAAHRMRDLIHSLTRGTATEQDVTELAGLSGVSEAKIKDFQTKAQTWGLSTQAADMLREELVAVADSGVNVREQEYYTVQSIAGGYVPLTRHGDYLVRFKYVDANGAEVRANTEYNTILPHFQSNDVEAQLRPIANEWNAANKDKLFPVVLEDAPLDAKGNPELTEVYIVATEPEHVKAQQVSTRTDYNAIETTLTAMGMRIPIEMRQELLKAMTNAEAAARHNLQRQGHPGFSMDFRKVISEHLSQRAAMAAFKTHAPEIDMLVGSDRYTDPESWGDGKDQIKALKAKYMAAAKDGGAGSPAAKVAHKELMSTAEAYFGQHEAVAAEMKAEMTPGNAKLRDKATALRKTSDDYIRLNAERFKGEAAKYAQWWNAEGALEETMQWAHGFKSAATVMQLGASFATAITNLSSLGMHTFATLASYNPNTGFGGGFGARASSAAIIKAVRALSPIMRTTALQGSLGHITFPETYMQKMVKLAEASADKTAGGYTAEAWKFLLELSERGVLDAQRNNAMMGQASRAMYGDTYGKITAQMMSVFAATEEMNRMATALAGYELFHKQADAAGMEGPELSAHLHKQIEKLVFATQGDYSEANRPRLFRNKIGSIVFMYKTFAVTSVELLNNLSPKGKAIFLGMLMAASGMGGLPFWEELMAVLDGVSQRTGLGNSITKGNAEREFRAWLHEMGLDKVMMEGIIDTMTGINVAGRAGINVGVPLIGLGRAKTDVTTEMGKALGPSIGVLKGLSDSLGSALHGDFETALRQQPLSGVRHLSDAYTYAKYGVVMNKRGQTVVDHVTPAQIIARALGYYPQELQEANNFVKLENYTRNYAKEISNRYIQEFNKAKIMHDSDRMREIRDEVREHNETFKGSSLYLENFSKKAEAASKEAVKSLHDRTVKGLSKGQRKEAVAAEMD